MTRGGRLGIAALVLLLAAGAAKPPAPSPENQLMAADHAFSQLSAAKGLSYALLATIANDGRAYGEGEAPAIGRAQVFRRLGRREAGSVSRNMETARVSADGRMGWTAGSWLRTVRGSKQQAAGHYLTVWTKDRRGAWKIQADMATADPVGKK